MANQPLARKPVPTAVQKAIREGYARPTTEGGSVPHEIEEKEESVPHDISQHDALVYRMQRLEANDVELARGLGDVNGKMFDMNGKIGSVETELKLLVKYADKADVREEREVERKAAEAAAEKVAVAAARAAEVTARAADRALDADLTKAKMTSREKIYLAVIALISTMLLGWFGLSHLAVK